MRKRIALITTYNQGAAGPRYIAGELDRHGHDVRFFHLKEFRAMAVPTADFERHEALRRRRAEIQFQTFQHPGEVLYVPYPSEITPKETDLLIEELRRYAPHIVGVSLFSVTVEVARKVTRWIHEGLPGLSVIWGGIHCMAQPDDCLKGMDQNPATGHRNALQVPDILCTAEGEDAMSALMNRWDEYANGGTPAIPGLWFITGTTVRKFEKPPPERDLDRFAFPLYNGKEILIDDNRVDTKLQDPRGWIRNHIYLFTERGCPYRCSFCIHSILNRAEKTWPRMRRRSVDKVLEEAEKRVRENGMTHFVIHDEILGIQKKWVMEFAAKWEKEFKHRGIAFTGYVHPLTTDGEMVEALYSAGMTQTGFGLQTGSRRLAREVYNRSFRREKVVALSETLSRFPFEVVEVELITDSVYETEKDRMETLELLLDMAPPFRVENFSLVVHSATALAGKTPPIEEIPWKDRLFWNMLYHLTGIPGLGKETVLRYSRTADYRENPLLLEALARERIGSYFQKIQGQLRDPGRLD